jgi:predicted RNase H-like HicB family nuclease
VQGIYREQPGRIYCHRVVCRQRERIMRQMAERIAFPLTFYLKQEGDQWAALSPEVAVSSCGDTLDEARQALKDAVETYVVYMIGTGRIAEIPRQLSQEQVLDFLTDPPGRHEVEEHVLLVSSC